MGKHGGNGVRVENAINVHESDRFILIFRIWRKSDVYFESTALARRILIPQKKLGRCAALILYFQSERYKNGNQPFLDKSDFSGIEQIKIQIDGESGKN